MKRRNRPTQSLHHGVRNGWTRKDHIVLRPGEMARECKSISEAKYLMRTGGVK